MRLTALKFKTEKTEIPWNSLWNTSFLTVGILIAVDRSGDRWATCRVVDIKVRAFRGPMKWEKYRMFYKLIVTLDGKRAASLTSTIEVSC